MSVREELLSASDETIERAPVATEGPLKDVLQRQQYLATVR